MVNEKSTYDPTEYESTDLRILERRIHNPDEHISETADALEISSSRVSESLRYFPFDEIKPDGTHSAKTYNDLNRNIRVSCIAALLLGPNHYDAISEITGTPESSVKRHIREYLPLVVAADRERGGSHAERLKWFISEWQAWMSE